MATAADNPDYGGDASGDGGAGTTLTTPGWVDTVDNIISGNTDTSTWKNLFDQLVKTGSTPAGAITGLAGLYQLFGNKGSQIAGYGGSIQIGRAHV